MSVTARPPMKVSARGLALIKSLEGFRPRALKRGNQWVVGYGHTVSAREGAMVSEDEASLLLQYDLLPIAKAIQDGVKTPIHQHQFDALASFAYSVGLEDFRGSDVLHRLNQGEMTLAADALIGWPESPSPESVVRRRAAERALFNTRAGQTAGVEDLLTSALPPVEEDGTVLPFPTNEDDEHLFAEDETPSAFPTTDAGQPVAAQGQAGSTHDAEETVPGPEVVSETSDAETAPDAEPARAARDAPMESVGALGPFGWQAALPYLLVGGAGFVGFGVAMGTLRLAAMPSARSGEIALIGWLLAALSIGFIGYAGWKMYQRWGRSDRD